MYLFQLLIAIMKIKLCSIDDRNEKALTIVNPSNFQPHISVNGSRKDMRVKDQGWQGWL